MKCFDVSQPERVKTWFTAIHLLSHTLLPSRKLPVSSSSTWILVWTVAKLTACFPILGCRLSFIVKTLKCYILINSSLESGTHLNLFIVNQAVRYQLCSEQMPDNINIKVSACLLMEGTAAISKANSELSFSSVPNFSVCWDFRKEC